MKNSISTEEALIRLQQLCSRAEKCEKDILDKLKKWNYEDDPLYIIGQLKENDFLNDERYVSAFINDKIKYSKWGKQKVRYELKMRSIDNCIIEESLNSFPEDLYIDILEAEVLKKNRTLKEPDLRMREKKLLSFSYQRGFELDLVRGIIDKILGET